MKRQRERGIDISIPFRFDGEQQPLAFGVSPASAKALRVGDYVGSVKDGGSCNCSQYEIIPHCHGTHTETIAHILEDHISVSDVVAGVFWQDALLISVTPEYNSTETYQPPREIEDKVITKQSILDALGGASIPEALLIRTLPNTPAKCSTNYSTTPPAYLTNDAVRLITESNVQHLVLDLPSLDDAWDGGLLSNHRIFWNVTPGSTRLVGGERVNAIITELAFIPDDASDGEYDLLTQVPRFLTDAAPSRLTIFPRGPKGGAFVTRQ